MTLFETHALCKTYRHGAVAALVDVHVRIAAGSWCVLRGPSGSGKTTLLAILGALERPTSGTVSLAGQDLSRCTGIELTRVRRRLGFVFQDFALLPGLPVWQNVTYHLIPRGIAQPERRRRAMELLDKFGLRDRAAARPEELSGGEQHRVAAARAFAGDPEMILADEPNSNLDPIAAGIINDALRAFHRSGKTVIVATHAADLLEGATQVIDLRAGRVEK
jgi:ABC-type lipoprotein export system ATPase subunit